ncbi:MAG: DinB family protein [Chloroflexota bacterium]
MTMQSHYQTLFAYHWHTTHRLLELVEKVAETAVFPTCHRTLSHLLSTNYSYRTALETSQQPAHLAADQFPTLDSLKTGFLDEQSKWNTLLASLSDDTIAGSADLTTLRGHTIRFARWRILQQVLLHGMQHHAELAQLLTEQGHSPGDLDFIFFQG